MQSLSKVCDILHKYYVAAPDLARPEFNTGILGNVFESTPVGPITPTSAQVKELFKRVNVTLGPISVGSRVIVTWEAPSCERRHWYFQSLSFNVAKIMEIPVAERRKELVESLVSKMRGVDGIYHSMTVIFNSMRGTFVKVVSPSNKIDCDASGCEFFRAVALMYVCGHRWYLVNSVSPLSEMRPSDLLNVVTGRACVSMQERAIRMFRAIYPDDNHSVSVAPSCSCSEVQKIKIRRFIKCVKSRDWERVQSNLLRLDDCCCLESCFSSDKWQKALDKGGDRIRWAIYQRLVTGGCACGDEVRKAFNEICERAVRGVVPCVVDVLSLLDRCCASADCFVVDALEPVLSLLPYDLGLIVQSRMVYGRTYKIIGLLNVPSLTCPRAEPVASAPAAAKRASSDSSAAGAPPSGDVGPEKKRIRPSGK
jgi:hypothetical protein